MKQIAKWAAVGMAAVAAIAAIPAAASTFTISNSGSAFTITRSGAGTNAAETVYYRAVSRSAIGGAHFSPAAGRLGFAARETTKTVLVSEHTAAQLSDATFLYYKSGTANGSSRTYRFEVTDEGGFTLASKDRSISYDSSKSVSSSAFAEKTVTVISSTATNVTDAGFNKQAYHPVPLDSYFSSTVPRDYLSNSVARLSVLVDLQAAEISDGYQYIQILYNQTSNCDTGDDNGDPGTPNYSCYLAAFSHGGGAAITEYRKYTFPLASATNNCGRINDAWNDSAHGMNGYGDLCQQRFKANCRAADGWLSVPASLATLGIRFDASGSGNDDWQVKNVTARIKAVPAGPSVKYNPVVTAQPVSKGSTVSVSLPFNEIVYVSGTPVLKTTWGDLSYVAGSGMNVLTFAGPVTAAAGTSLRITGLTGTVKGLTDVAFAWSGSIDVSRTVDAAVAPPQQGNVYQLSIPAHLLWFANRVASSPNSSAALVADIDMTSAPDFTAMGGANGFAGVFDGRGHAISGLSVNSADPAGRIGLFGQIAAQGVVSNLVLSGVSVTVSASPALAGMVCGRNLGTVTLCSVSGSVSTSGSSNGFRSALGGICGENAGVVRDCCLHTPLTSGGVALVNRWSGMTVGGVVGTNAVSGTVAGCFFYGLYSDYNYDSITRGAVCGSNAGTIRDCVGLHDNSNYMNGSVGANSGTVENTLFPEAVAFTGGEACYALNGGVTDGSRPWRQTLGTDDLPQFSGAIVLPHGNIYCNEIVHDWGVIWAHSSDYSNGTWTVVCSIGGETNLLSATAGTAAITTQPTCTTVGQTTWAYAPPENDYGLTTTNVVQHGVPAALGHDWCAPVWSWDADCGAANATFTCSRCGAEETVPAAVTRVADGTNVVSTATATHHGETFTATESVSVTPWKALQWRLDAGGTVTLANDVTATDGDATLIVTNAVTLDLAGHTIDAAGRFRVITIDSGGHLTLTNSIPETGAITGGNSSDYYGGGVYVDNGGTFTMTGGAISGNSADFGGGVYVGRGGTFTMTSGAISGNSAGFYGGGVEMSDGTFTMSGGAISGNFARYGGGVDADGTFTVSGDSVISGNTNSAGTANNVYLFGSTQIVVGNLTAGASIGVTAKTESTAGSSVIVGTGAVAGDEAYFTSDLPAFAVEVADGELRLVKQPSPWDLLQAQIDAGGTVTLTNDVTATDGDATLIVTNAVTLDLAGHTIDAAGRFRVITIASGGHLTLTNNIPASGAITGGNASSGGGVYVNNGGTFTMSGGAISGNSASYYGGGVYVGRGGTFTMTGGEISGNSAGSYGGGVEVYDGTFTMAGGAISGNSALYGGGVDADGTFTVSGSPVVSGNTNSAGTANNVYLYTDTTITVGNLTAGASLGVTTYTEPTAGSPVTIGTGAVVGDEAYFTSDLPAFAVKVANGELRLVIVTSSSPWDLLQAQIDAGGTVTLTNDVTATDGDATVIVANAVVLDLAGHTIDAAGRFRVITIHSGGHLTLTNSIPASGAITGGNASYGGGVFVDNGGTFTMSGGEISGNSASSYGGGVYVNYGGAFTVSGDPRASGNTNSAGKANNVYLYNDTTITVSNLTAGAFLGVTTEQTPMDGNPVTITANAAPGDIAYFFSDDPDYSVKQINGELCLTVPTNWEELQTLIDAAEDGETIVLDSNYIYKSPDGGGNGGIPEGSEYEGSGSGGYHSGSTVYPSGSPLTISDGKSITIDLNGHTIDGKGESQVFYVGYGGTLTLTNSVPESGAVTGGYAEYGGGVCVADGGTFTLAGGSISGNSASGGGGVHVEGNGTFAMTGGTISGNTAEDDGGGVYVSGNGTFTMTGGTISGNDSYWAGGVDACGTFTMTGGEISGNSANSTGGGVYVDWGGAFTMTGGEISGNSGGYYGGGVYVDDGGTFTVSDDPVVSGNTNSVGTANNVYLPNNTKIAVSNLTAGASIGVTTEIMPAESDPVTITTGAAAGDSQYFHSDIETLSAVMAEGEVRLERSFYTPWEVLQIQLNAGGVVTLTNDIVARAADATLTVTNAVTLDLGGHTIDAAGRFRVIEIKSGGNLTLTNSIPETGTITGGKTYQGGGVCVGRDGAFTMTGGAISGNTASYGGGVYVEDYSTFAMTGGTISGNFGEYGGGGVYVDWDGTFTASGDPLVSGNTNSLGTANNVYLHINRIIAVSNLTAGASLGVTTQTVPSEGSPVTITTGAAAGDSQYFFSDNPAYLAGTAANGQVCLACGIVYPAYLAGADETVTNNWVNWATKYGANTNAAYEACFLLDISPATAIPHGAALLRVVRFELTATGYRFELASDIAKLARPADADDNRLGNGYIAVDVAAVLSEAWCRVVASATVDANGHAIVDVTCEDVDWELSWGGYGTYPDSASYFFRPVLTPVQPVSSSHFRPPFNPPGWKSATPSP